MANTLNEARTVSIRLEGLKTLADATAITLDLSQYDLENTVDSPRAIEPHESKVQAEGNQLNVTIDGKNFVVFKVKK